MKTQIKSNLKKLVLLIFISATTTIEAANVIKLDTVTMNNGATDWNVAPTATDIGEFGSIPSANTLVNMTLGGNLTLSGLQFDDTLAGPVIVTDNTYVLTLGSGGIDMTNANQNVSLNCDIELGANLTNSESSGSTLTLGGVVNDGGDGFDLIQEGAGTLILTASNSYSGGTLLDGGTLQLGNGGSTGDAGFGTISLLSGSCTLNIDRSDSPIFTNAITRDITGGGPIISVNSETVTLSGQITGTGGELKAYGPGTLILANTNNNFGQLTFYTTVEAVDPGAWGGAQANDIAWFDTGTLDYTGTASGTFNWRGITGFGVIEIDNPWVTLTNSQAVSGGGNTGNEFTKNGPGTLVMTGGLDNSGSFSGYTTINDGTMEVDGEWGNGNAGVTYIGTVTVAGGILAGSGSIAGSSVIVESGGTIAPGNNGGVGGMGTLTIGGDLSLAGNAVFTLNRTNVQNATEVVATANDITYGGTLTVTNIGPDLQAGDIFTLFTASTYSGEFSTVVLPPLTSGLVWQTNDLAVNGTIQVVNPGVSSIGIQRITPTSGLVSGGTMVTIIGSNFLNGVTVQFGTNPPAVATFIDSTELMVTTPANAVGGEVEVIVVNPNESSATSQFTYDVNPSWINPLGGEWSIATNWVGNLIADDGVLADFSTLDITADTTVHLDSPRTLGGLIFGDTDISTPASWILDNSGNAGNVLTLAGSTPTITVNGLGTGKSVTIGAMIAGTTGLTMAGTGTLILTGTNTYDGGTALTAGTLQLGNGGTTGDLGGGIITLSCGATLNINRSDSPIITNAINDISGNGNKNSINVPNGLTATLSGPISNGPGGGEFSVYGGGTLVLANTNNNFDQITIYNGSTVEAANPGDWGGVSAPACWIDGGTFSYTGTANATFNFRGIATTGIIDVVNNTPTFLTNTASIAGGGTLTKTGPGTLVLADNASTGVGTVTVNEGALLINSLVSESAATVAANAILGGSGTNNCQYFTSVYGTLAPGENGVGTFTIGGDLLMEGGNISIALNKALSPGLSNSYVNVSGQISDNGGGSLIVTNLGPALAVGDRFTIFNQAMEGDSFTIVGPAGVIFTNNLAVDGSISVIAATPTPTPTPATIVSLVRSGSNLNLVWQGGTNAACTLLTATNVTQPLSSWMPVVTNVVGANGLSTNSILINAGEPQRFYLLAIPGN